MFICPRTARPKSVRPACSVPCTSNWPRPTDEAPRGQLKNGSVIPLARAATYPTTEQTLASVAILLNGGGLGHIQELTRTFATALNGREKEMRSLLTQLDIFVTETKKQTDDIIAAIESVNQLAGQVADKDQTVDKALTTIPQALGVLSDTRQDAGRRDRQGRVNSALSPLRRSSSPRSRSSTTSATSRRRCGNWPTPGLRSPGAWTSSPRCHG